MDDAIALSAEGVSKAFPGVQALDCVDFTLRKGEIHALMGENGAGKSTLIRILNGVCREDSGKIRINGFADPVRIRSPKEAQRYGISTVYQELQLCQNLTVSENLFIGRGSRILVNRKQAERKAGELLERFGIPARPKQMLRSCSIAVRQMIAIARAADTDCKILILDEPTSSLDDRETAMLFRLMRKLKADGTAIIFVTHFLDQVYEVSDRITVLRNGKLVGEYLTSALPRIELVAAMIGREANGASKQNSCPANTRADGDTKENIYEARGLSSVCARAFDFHIAKGEVNGFTGLLGSGRSECVRAIFGADRITGGTTKTGGREVRIIKPIDAMRNGLAYLPEDRKRDGVIDDMSVRENIILALQVRKGFFHPVKRAESEILTDRYIKMLGIKAASREAPASSMSGGNQQKTLISRWLLTQPVYLILDEPTRGIDVGTKAEILRIVRKLSEEGMSVTFISSEIEEMLDVCTRLIVMRDGRIAGELTGSGLTEENIMRTIAGEVQ